MRSRDPIRRIFELPIVRGVLALLGTVGSLAGLPHPLNLLGAGCGLLALGFVTGVWWTMRSTPVEAGQLALAVFGTLPRLHTLADESEGVEAVTHAFLDACRKVYVERRGSQSPRVAVGVWLRRGQSLKWELWDGVGLSESQKAAFAFSADASAITQAASRVPGTVEFYANLPVDLAPIPHDQFTDLREIKDAGFKSVALVACGPRMFNGAVGVFCDKEGHWTNEDAQYLESTVRLVMLAWTIDDRNRREAREQGIGRLRPGGA